MGPILLNGSTKYSAYLGQAHVKPAFTCFDLKMGFIPTFRDILRIFLVERSGHSRKAIDKLHIFHVLKLTQPNHVQFKEESETSPYEL